MLVKNVGRGVIVLKEQKENEGEYEYRASGAEDQK